MELLPNPKNDRVAKEVPLPASKVADSQHVWLDFPVKSKLKS